MEKHWYERAFGNKRNLMNYRVSFEPPSGKMKKNIDYFADIKYTMFKEMEDEFKPSDYAASIHVQLTE